MTGYFKCPHTALFTDPTGCRRRHLALDLIEKEYSGNLTASSLFAQRSYRKRYIMSNVELDMMTMFDLSNLKASYING